MYPHNKVFSIVLASRNPVLHYRPAIMPAFSQEMPRRKTCVVIVGYPATSLVTSCAHFCVSAAHKKGNLFRLLAACDAIDVSTTKKSEIFMDR